MKTLYLHIGTPKTGTSVIQNFLKTNTETLHEQSFRFPILPYKWPGVPTQRNGHFLDLPDSSLIHPDMTEPKPEWRQHYAEGLAMVHREFETYDNLILSEEDLWNAVNYAPLNVLEQMKEDAALHDYCLKVVVYLRRQDLLLTSLWNQKVKVGMTAATLPDYIEQLLNEKPLYADYDRTLQKISDIVGFENIIVRRYEPSAWVGQSICLDFLTAIGLDPNLPFKLPAQKETNTSLNGNIAEIRRIINGTDFLSDEEKRVFKANTRRFESESKAGKSSYQHLSAKDAAALLARFQEGNDRVAKEYLREDRSLFTEEIKDYPMWQADETMTADTIRFFLALSQQLYQQNQELYRQNQKLANTDRLLANTKTKLKHLRDTLKGKNT
ncbi:MAG: hypothetical protein LIO94_09410 [Clostridiales bacterium]|nr:hypothetical protein [Clostridiales bacterium]